MNGVENTVFIVEDALAVRMALTRILRAAGYRSDRSNRRKSSWQNMTSGAQGCLLLDVCMPGLSGIELQRELVGHRMPSPIVFLTGNG